MSSTWVVALLPTSISASIPLISVWLVLIVSRCTRCAYWDHEEKKQKVCFVTDVWDYNVWDYKCVGLHL